MALKKSELYPCPDKAGMIRKDVCRASKATEYGY